MTTQLRRSERLRNKVRPSYYEEPEIIRQTTIKKSKTKIIQIQPSNNKYKKSTIIPLSQRKRRSIELFNNNKVSDEYYTRGNTWARFIVEERLLGQTICEPFYGDGSSRDALKGLVNVVGISGDFWDNLSIMSNEYILTNPPFSFKWLIIQTFLEMKRPFAMIMPWQVFYGTSRRRLDEYRDIYGGRWEKFELTSREQDYWSPTQNKMVKIGTSILVWRF
jgi:hypothetical protein